MKCYSACGCGRTGRTELPARFWWENVHERDHFENLGVDGKIILNEIYKNYDRMSWVAFIWLSTDKRGEYL
jgi:hypothetical protein